MAMSAPTATKASDATPRAPRARRARPSSSARLAGRQGQARPPAARVELVRLDAICQWCVVSAALMTALATLAGIRVLREATSAVPEAA